MPYRKFKADELFNGITLLTDSQVLITDPDGKIEDIVPADQAGDDVQELTGMLCPGFVNCHCHLELSHLAGVIPEKTGLVDFVSRIITERFTDPERIQESIASAEGAMIQNGILAVGDICNTIDTLQQKQKANLVYHNFVEVSGWVPEYAETRITKSRNFYQQFSSIGASSMVPHAPYSVSTALWQLLQLFCSGNVVTMHNQETAFEDALFLNKTGDFLRMFQQMNLDTSWWQPTGKSSLQSVFGYFAEAERTILVHNTFTSVDDVAFIRNTGAMEKTFFCLCPNANQYIEEAFPPVAMLQQEGCQVVLGTDSLASNHQLDLLSEMKTILASEPLLPTAELLGWATLNGARALNLESSLGSFEQGKTPGILLLDHIADGSITEKTRATRLL